VLGSNEQVDVIRHQDVRVNLASVLGARCRKATLEDTVVHTRHEERRPIVAALDYMLGLAREGETWQSRHGHDATRRTRATRYHSAAILTKRIQGSLTPLISEFNGV
jgi:hypothetical protein